MKSYDNFKFWREGFLKFISKKNQIDENTKPTEEEYNWNTWWLHIDRYKSKTKQTKVIIIHGIGTNGRLMSIYAVPLNKAGFEVIVPDLPGYGLSNFEKHNMVYENWIDSISDLVNKEKISYKGNIVLMGVGMGGIVAYDIAAKNPNVSAVAATSLVDFNDRTVLEELFENRFVGKNIVSIINMLFKFNKDMEININNILKMKNLTEQYSFSKLLNKDKLSGGRKLSVKFIKSLIHNKTRVKPENFRNTPVLLLLSEKDKLTPSSLSSVFYNKLECPKEKVVLEKSGHLPFETPGIRQLEDAVINFLNKIEKSSEAPKVERTLYAADL